MVVQKGFKHIVSALFCMILALAGCLPGGSSSAPDAGLPGPSPPQVEQAPAAPLPVAVFLAREGKLEAVFRSLPVTPEEGPRAALEALVAGPTPYEERQGYRSVLPFSTGVLGVAVQDDVATADFSREIITRSDEVGGGSQAESLALQAIYLTLAQFPGVARVKVLVEGQSEGTVDGRSIKDFWGHVGLPAYLEGEVAVLRAADRQRVGDQAVVRQAGGLRLKSVRWWAHPTLFRTVFEVDGPGGAALGGIPPAEASFSPAHRTLYVSIPGVKESAVTDLSAGQGLSVDDWRVEKLSWEKVSPCSFRLTLAPERSYGWRLWGMTEPSRIILDVYSTGSASR